MRPLEHIVNDLKKVDEEQATLNAKRERFVKELAELNQATAEALKNAGN